MTRGKIQPISTPRSLAFVDNLLSGQPDWQEALCAQSDPDAWFPPVGVSARDAKQICRSCADRVRCLDWAMDNRERHGVWGGATPRERRRLAAERGIDWSEKNRRVDERFQRAPQTLSDALVAARLRNVAIARENKKRGVA